MKYIVIVFISLFVLSSCNSKLGIEVNTSSDCEANVLPEKDLSKLMLGKDLMGIQFVDIRTPHNYALGHLPGAINVPMDNFFNEKRFDSINKDDMVVLYGDDSSTPKMMSLLATHFKKGNFYVASGGYQFLKEKYLDKKENTKLVFNDEVAIVDFQQEIDSIKIKAGGVVDKSVKKKKKLKKPVVRGKKKKVSGGCG